MPGEEPGPTPRTKGQRFDALDGLRGIAALAIVVYHAYQNAQYPYSGSGAGVFFTSLDAGVDLFFVLSGFVIFLPFARASIAGLNRPSIPIFLARRAARILPLYYVLFLGVWAIRYTGYPGQVRDLWQHLSFTHVFDAERIFWTIGPAWSIADEVMYYLAIALIAAPLTMASGALKPRWARIATASLVPALAVVWSLAWKANAYSSGIPFDHWPTYFGPIARLDGFALGMLLAVLVASRANFGQTSKPRLRRWGLAGAAVVGMGVVVAAGAMRGRSDYGALYFHSASSVGFLLILVGLVFARGPPGPVNRWLSSRPMVLLGTLSYGLYLWHEPILIELSQRDWILRSGSDAFVANALVLPILALLAATLTYATLERPAMAWAARRLPSRSKLMEELPRGTPASGAVPPWLRKESKRDNKPRQK